MTRNLMDRLPRRPIKGDTPGRTPPSTAGPMVHVDTLALTVRTKSQDIKMRPPLRIRWTATQKTAAPDGLGRVI